MVVIIFFFIVEFIKTWEGFPENDQKFRPRRISKWATEPKGLDNLG